MAETTNSSNFADSNKFTGIVKWLDSQGIGYILPDKPSLPEAFIIPSSLSSDVIKEGDCVEFILTYLHNYTPINSYVAIKVTPLGEKCIFCKRFGHGFLSCDHLRTRICSRCGVIGHVSKSCDQKLKGWFFDKKPQKRIGGKSWKESFSDGGSFGMSWVSLFGGGGGKAKASRGSRPIVCVKRKEDVKKVEEVEDCFILEGFDPNHHYDDGGVKSIVCVKKVEDVKKVEEVEDCFILEFDPSEVELDKLSNLSLNEKYEFKNDDDDVVIFGEKGKVACRDYPHPRHLCATYPFKKTSHDLHCKMCYCYLCDIPAPCKKWNNGSNSQSLNHCDANEKFLPSIHLDFEKRQAEGR